MRTSVTKEEDGHESINQGSGDYRGRLARPFALFSRAEVSTLELSKNMFVAMLVSVLVAVTGIIVLTIVLASKHSIAQFFNDYISAIFSDFVLVSRFVLSDNPYHPSVGSSYPPIAILLLLPFALICEDVLHLGAVEILQSWQFWLSYMLYICVCYIILFFLIKRVAECKGKALVFLILSLFLCAMNIFALIRGNVVFVALILTLIFWAFRDSKNKWLRELALVGLAFAGAIKIYPLFFGVILLKQRRLFESARVAAYFFILLFVPFAAFEGGFVSNVQLFLQNLGGFGLDGVRLLSPRNLSIFGLSYKAFDVIGTIFNVNILEQSKGFATACAIVLFVMAVSGALSGDRLALATICACVLVVMPSVSYYYSMLFLIFPYIEFLNTHGSISYRRRNIYILFFLFCMSIIIVATAFYLIHAVLLIAILLLEAASSIYKFARKKMSKEVLSV